MMNKDLSVVIPAYNEAENLTALLPGMIQFCSERGYKLIIVNDGSRDNSAEILNNYLNSELLTVITHKVNRGYGGSIKSGIEACQTVYFITIDADGQHRLEDIDHLFGKILETDADMIVGSRRGTRSATTLRGIGKSIIRGVAKMMMTIPIHDINSGMKIYRADLGKLYMSQTPDSMSFSDVITLIFIFNRHLVLEEPIRIKGRLSGKSTIGMNTAFQTILEILNIVILFNPMKVFIPVAIFIFVTGLLWGLKFILAGEGLSIGASTLILLGIIVLLLGLIAEQLSAIRKKM